MASSTTTTTPQQKTEALYQKDGTLHTYSSRVSSVAPLSSLPEDAQSLFKSPGEDSYVLTTPATIFHAQGGGQPSDTGTMVSTTPEGETTFHVHQVRKADPAILHMGVFAQPDGVFNAGDAIVQSIDVEKRHLHSRLHTAGHIVGLAVHLLSRSGVLPPDIVDGKASHFPSAANVEFVGLIPGDKKAAIQAQVDDLVRRDLPVSVYFWSEEQARERCFSGTENVRGDENGVRVIDLGGLGSNPCGGTHVARLGEVGKVVVRGVKRQKGISRVSYEIEDA